MAFRSFVATQNKEAETKTTNDHKMKWLQMTNHHSSRQNITIAFNNTILQGSYQSPEIQFPTFAAKEAVTGCNLYAFVRQIQLHSELKNGINYAIRFLSTTKADVGRLNISISK